MNKSQEQNKQVQTNENLRKLVSILQNKEIYNSLGEIRKAKDSLRASIEKINSKIEVVSPKPVLSNTSNERNVTQRNNYQQNRDFKDRNQRFDNRQNDGKKFGERNSFDKNKRPFDSKNPNSKPFNKPFGDKKPRIDNSAIEFKPKDNTDRNFGNKKKTHEQPTEKKTLNKKAQLRMGYVVEDEEDENRLGRRFKAKKKEEQKAFVPSAQITHAVITTDNLTVKDLSEAISRPVTEIVKKLFILGIMATVNSNIDYDTAELVAGELGVTLERKVAQSYEEQLEQTLESAITEDEGHLIKRPPVVTVMGHVDHGKTSLLDAIRKTNVISGEAGGITQHIGAYTVKCKGEQITFIDTPGHAAFTSMRARGAQITDIAILVVAADDGIMPQTIEAISHIKNAKVPMIVAINKMDKLEANPDRVMKQLAEHDVLAEDWGGDTICVPISAKKGENIDKLLEMVLLVAEMQDLKANPDRPAVGTIIEAKLDKGKGPVATVLVQNGTLKTGDTVVSGIAIGRVRAMTDENGKSVKTAGPSTPVYILGLDEVPQSGDKLTVIDEKMSKLIAEERKNKIKLDKIKAQQAVSVEDFFNKVKDGELKNLNVIIKADVQGSCEALKQSVIKIKNEEAKVSIVHAGVGAVNESDVLLAEASNAKIIAFNVKTEPKAKTLAEKDKIDINAYSVIYECLEDLERTIKGMQAPKYQEKIVGHAEIRKLFKISSVGTIAGSYVLDGKIVRNAKVRLFRDGQLVTETEIATLQIGKDNAKEVNKGFECGIKLDGFNDLQEGDVIEAYINEEIKF